MNATAEQPESESITLEKKDLEILRLVELNAKLTVREISAQIGLSSTPTHERLKRLEKTGVIRHYSAILDKRKINKGIMVICMVTLKEHTKKAASEFICAVKDFKEVLECYNISGDFDFMLKIITESMDSYHQFFVNKLTEVNGIGQTKSTFVMNTVKETHRML